MSRILAREIDNPLTVAVKYYVGDILREAVLVLGCV